MGADIKKNSWLYYLFAWFCSNSESKVASDRLNYQLSFYVNRTLIDQLGLALLLVTTL